MWKILTVLSLVFLVCGPVWGIARYLKVPLPKFLLPGLAGITMLSFQIYSSYTGMNETVSKLPEDVVVLKEFHRSSILEPWTFLVPPVSHFIAADEAQTRINPDRPEIKMGEVLMVQEHQDAMSMSVLVDCDRELASVVPTSKIAEGVNPLDVAAWTEKKEFPYIISHYCQAAQ
jgi:hypothetical protein